jgi:hypothetical protein
MPASASHDSGQPEQPLILAQAADVLGTTGRPPCLAVVPAGLPDVPESRDERIRRIVDEAPPLSPQQCDQLARLMRPSSWGEPEVSRLQERRAS